MNFGTPLDQTDYSLDPPPDAAVRAPLDYQLLDALTRGDNEEFLVYDEIDKWRDFGGIRNEEDFLITEDGHRRLGPAKPLTTGEVEALKN